MRADAAGVPATPTARRRHCWVSGPAEDPGSWLRLIVEWARAGSTWTARVAYTIEEGTLIERWVERWVDASQLSPA